MKKFERLRRFFVLALILCISIPAFSEKATLTFIKGKVEVSHDGNEWVPLKVGDAISEKDIISTGFQSEAKVKYNGSVLLMGALTRITLSQLSSSKSKDNVDVFLNTGAVRSKVTHSEDKKVSYTVRSPVAVACVRGTDFIARSTGRVDCLEGAVAVFSARMYDSIMGSSDSGQAEEEEESESTESESSSVDSGDSGDQSSDSSSSDSSSGSGDGPVITSSNSGKESEKAQGPANATTPAKDINEHVPSNAIVVGKNQATEFTPTTSGSKPQDFASSNVQKVKASMSSAATQEAVSFGSPATSDAPKPVAVEPVVTQGSVTVSFTFED